MRARIGSIVHASKINIYVRPLLHCTNIHSFYMHNAISALGHHDIRGYTEKKKNTIKTKKRFGLENQNREDI